MDLVPRDHLVRFIRDLVREALDLGAILAASGPVTPVAAPRSAEEIDCTIDSHGLAAQGT
jgi:hypothetical protein